MGHKQESSRQQILGRALAVWCIIIAAEVLHGVLRVALLEPRVGDFRARQIAVFTGCVIILTITFAFVRWLNASQAGQLFGIGVLWLYLMLGFELLLGRVVFGYSWEQLLADYDLPRGGLLGIGMLILMLAPFIAGKLRGLV